MGNGRTLRGRGDGWLPDYRATTNLSRATGGSIGATAHANPRPKPRKSGAKGHLGARPEIPQFPPNIASLTAHDAPTRLIAGKYPLPLINNQRKSNMARGGKREGAGRPEGAVNKATSEVREAAQAFTTDALETLASIMRSSESDAARVAAANALLDRGHGKPKQSVDVDANVKAAVTQVRRTIVDPRNPDS